MADKVDQLERVTNLLALLLETRQPITLAQITAELSGQYPSKESALRAAFERGQGAVARRGVCRSRPRRSAGIKRARWRTGSTGVATSCPISASPMTSDVRCRSPWPPSTSGPPGARRRCGRSGPPRVQPTRPELLPCCRRSLPAADAARGRRPPVPRDVRLPRLGPHTASLRTARTRGQLVRGRPRRRSRRAAHLSGRPDRGEL